jgi:WD40 repeat protein
MVCAQVESESISATLGGQPAILSVDVSLAASLIASAHTDHAVRVWDSRLQQAALQLKLAHPGWAACVRWCPHQQHLLASACYDGTVRLWDVRSSIPLHELKAHTDAKALCLAWDGAERLASGGSDAQMHVAAVAPPPGQ